MVNFLTEQNSEEDELPSPVEETKGAEKPQSLEGLLVGKEEAEEGESYTYLIKGEYGVETKTPPPTEGNWTAALLPEEELSSIYCWWQELLLKEGYTLMDEEDQEIKEEVLDLSTILEKYLLDQLSGDDPLYQEREDDDNKPLTIFLAALGKKGSSTVYLPGNEKD